jgi:hypothetical protein
VRLRERRKEWREERRRDGDGERDRERRQNINFIILLGGGWRKEGSGGRETWTVRPTRLFYIT